MADQCKTYAIGNFDVQENGIVRDNTKGGLIIGRLNELDNGVAAENWKETAAQFARNTEFYHNIVIQIGEMFGEESKVSDDDSVQEDVLALKVPELVARLKTELDNKERETAEKCYKLACRNGSVVTSNAIYDAFNLNTSESYYNKP